MLTWRSWPELSLRHTVQKKWLMPLVGSWLRSAGYAVLATQCWPALTRAKQLSTALTSLTYKLHIRTWVVYVWCSLAIPLFTARSILKSNFWTFVNRKHRRYDARWCEHFKVRHNKSSNPKKIFILNFAGWHLWSCSLDNLSSFWFLLRQHNQRSNLSRNSKLCRKSGSIWRSEN